MTNILEISDGTTTVNLLSPSFGFCLNSWQPQIAQPKRGGIFQSSSLSEGRMLVDRKFENIEDNFNFDIKGSGQSETITYITKLINLLEQATEYWTGYANKVWIKAKADCEANPRYALIVNYSWPELKFPYGKTFFTATEIASMINVDLGLEHELWLDGIPGIGNCIEASNNRTWEYDGEWEAKINASATNTGLAILATNNYLYMSDGGNILRSIDNGENWTVSTALPANTDIARSLVQLANGDILAGNSDTNGNIFRTQDNGASWGTPGAVSGTAGNGIEWLMQLTNGDILAFYNDTAAPANTFKVDVSTDAGATWANRATLPNRGSPNKVAQLSNGNLLAANKDVVMISEDNGSAWNNTFRFATTTDQSVLIVLSNGDILYGAGDYTLATDVGELSLYKSEDNGSTWENTFNFNSLITTANANFAFNSLFETTTGTLYISTTGNTPAKTYSSVDGGVSWIKEYELTSNPGFAPIIEAANGQVLQGDAGGVIAGKDPNSTTAGSDGLCTNGTFVANKTNSSQLTHIKIEDNSLATFTDIYPIAAFPQELFPNPIEQNDAIYFGIDPNIVFVDNVFNNLVFDIDTTTMQQQLEVSGVYTWEYWDGGAWNNLSGIGEIISDRTLLFSNPGVNSINWDVRSDWATTTVDGVTAYWVRCRMSSASAVDLQVPTQQNRQIYTTSWAYAETLAAQVVGDIPALLRAKIYNTSSEEDIRTGNDGTWSNRIIIGLKSYTRGSLFQAFLNASDEVFDPVGIVSLGTNTTFQTDITVPTGKYSQYNPAGVEAMADRVTFTIPQSVMDDFRGIYHAFVRVQRTAGAITDFDIQLQVVGGSGGTTFTTDSVQVQSTDKWELLDFGRIQIPTGNINDTSDITTIVIQASAASGTPNLNIYDLVIIPVDEWAGDFVDFENSDASIIGASPNVAFSDYLDIDSVTDPKVDIKSPVRRGDGSDFKIADYDAISPGKALLNPNRQQRLWVLSARTNATGNDYQWISEPWVLHSVQLTGNNRFLTFSEGEA